MRTIYLIRHGTPDYGPGDKRFIGITDIPLSERGQKEAEKLGALFADVDQGIRIFTSPLQRCRATAGIIHRMRMQAGFPEQITVRDDLREIDLGDWEGCLIREIREKYPEEYRKRGNEIWSYRTPEGESFEEAGRRFGKAVDEARSQSGPDQDLMIVSHAGVIRAYLTILLRREGKEIFSVPMPYAGITTLKDSGTELTADPSRIGWKPEVFLTKEEISFLYRKYETPLPVIRHMEKVAETAAEIVREIPKAQHLHFDRIRRASLLHDLLRTKKDHAHVSARAVRMEGYPEIAKLIAEHHSADFPPEEENGPLTDEEIVFYADKLVLEDRVVTVEERFAKSLAKCKTDEALTHHEAMYRKTLAIQRKIDEMRK